MSEELKACPFCGSEARLMIKESQYDTNYDIQCTDDKCYLSEGADWYFDTEEEAIQAWNRRSQEGANR